MRARPIELRLPRWALVAAAAVALVWLASRLVDVLAPVFVSFLIAYLLDPLVDRLEKRRCPRAAAVAVLITIGALLGVLFFVVGVPFVGREVAAFTQTLPEKVNALRLNLEPWLAHYGLVFPTSFSEALATAHIDTADLAENISAPLSNSLKWIFSRAGNAIGAVFGALMIPIIAAYMLYDFDNITQRVRSLVPHAWRSSFIGFMTEVDEALSEFVRGQLIVMAALAILYAIGYALIGVPMAIVIGVLAGLLSFIPYVGGALALMLALMMCGLHWQGWQQILSVIVVYACVQLLEGFVITPKIIGDKVGLSSLWVIIALMVGGELFGFVGILLAVPSAAVLKIALSRALGAYEKSPFFSDISPDPHNNALLPKGLWGNSRTD